MFSVWEPSISIPVLVYCNCRETEVPHDDIIPVAEGLEDSKTVHAPVLDYSLRTFMSASNIDPVSKLYHSGRSRLLKFRRP
jgi:hypothetical protein